MHTKRLACALALSLLPMLVGGCEENLTPAPDRDLYMGTGEQVEFSCYPDLDGKITASELTETLGVSVSYLVNPPGTMPAVDIAGQINTAGERRWDFSRDAASDQIARLEADPVQGKWYASSFPTGQFVTASDLGGSIENIYRRDEDGFYLLGIASAEENPAEGKTLIIYETPVALYLFPLEKGKTWVSVGTTRNAMFYGIPYAGKDTYEVSVEDTGELLLPDLIFEQAMMVRTTVKVEPAVGQSVTQQQVGFLFECFGEVARATAPTGVTEPNFTNAVELRRLGIEP